MAAFEMSAFKLRAHTVRKLNPKSQMQKGSFEAGGWKHPTATPPFWFCICGSLSNVSHFQFICLFSTELLRARFPQTVRTLENLFFFFFLQPLCSVHTVTFPRLTWKTIHRVSVCFTFCQQPGIGNPSGPCGWRNREEETAWTLKLWKSGLHAPSSEPNPSRRFYTTSDFNSHAPNMASIVLSHSINVNMIKI